MIEMSMDNSIHPGKLLALKCVLQLSEEFLSYKIKNKGLDCVMFTL